MRNLIKRFTFLLAVMLLFTSSAQADLFPGLRTPVASTPEPTPTATKSSLFVLPGLPATGPRFSDWSKIRPAAERTLEQGSVSVFVSVSENDILAYGEYLERHGYQLEPIDSAPDMNAIMHVYQGTDYAVLLMRVQELSLVSFLVEAVVSAGMALEESEATFTAALEEMLLELADILATPTPVPTPAPTSVPTSEPVISVQVPTADVNASAAHVDKPTECPYCTGTGVCQDCIDGKCDKCFGDRTEDCPRCNGSGACSNFECNGGTITYYRNGDIATRKCPTCGGSGNCNICKGQGTIKCSKCNGSGNCLSCGGSAQCKYCKGKGQR